jgi:hypothetical protein
MTLKTCLPFGVSNRNFVCISLPSCACYFPDISKKHLMIWARLTLQHHVVDGGCFCCTVSEHSSPLVQGPTLVLKRGTGLLQSTPFNSRTASSTAASPSGDYAHSKHHTNIMLQTYTLLWRFGNWIGVERSRQDLSNGPNYETLPLTYDDGRRSSFRNVVNIRYNPKSGQFPLWFHHSLGANSGATPTAYPTTAFLFGFQFGILKLDRYSEIETRSSKRTQLTVNFFHFTHGEQIQFPKRQVHYIWSRKWPNPAVVSSFTRRELRGYTYSAPHDSVSIWFPVQYSETGSVFTDRGQVFRTDPTDSEPSPLNTRWWRSRSSFRNVVNIRYNPVNAQSALWFPH